MSNADNIMILEIARKFSAVPPGLPGIRFRSLRGGQAADTLPREAKLLLTAPDCSDFRQRIAACQRCNDRQNEARFSLAGVALKDRQLAKWDVRIPEPLHLLRVDFAHGNQF